MKVCVAGAGYFARQHHAAWARIAGVEVTGIADLDLARAREAARGLGASAYADAETMLDKCRPDLLDIATPPATHGPLIRMAAARGVDVACQKPFCGGLAGAQEAVEVARMAGIRLVVHENVRFQPWYAAIADELKTWGRLYQATFRLRPGDGAGADAYRARQPYFRTMERFLVHETLVHWIDTFRCLFAPSRSLGEWPGEGDVASVWADLRRINEGIAGEDAGVIVLAFESGFRGVLDANRCADHAATDRRRTMGELSIEGADGELTLDGEANIVVRRGTELREIDYAWDDVGFGGDCVFLFQSRLADALRTGEPMPNEGAPYLRNLEIVEAVYRSAAQGRRVAV